MSEKDDALRRLAASIDAAARWRARARESSRASSARDALRAWQASRLSRTYADLLASKDYGEAARFFLTDLYGPADVSSRDALMQRALPVMAKMLSASALDAAADAVELDALSESLDADMVASLGAAVAHIDMPAYARAYRQTGRHQDRARQVLLIAHFGAALEKLSHKRGAGAALALMRKPARLAGFGELQLFLERGYAAFHKMKTVATFIDSVISREKAFSAALFAGDESPPGA